MACVCILIGKSGIVSQTVANPLPFSSYTMQWHSLIHILDMLRLYPNMTDAEKAWKVISDTYANNPEMLRDMRKPIHVAVGSLCLKAWQARETTSQLGPWTFDPLPDFISRLRDQQEATALKNKARAAAKEGTANTNASHFHTSASESVRTQDHTALNTDMTFENEQNQQQTSFRPLQPSESDPFYYLESYGDDQFDSTQRSMDLDFILAQDYTSDGSFQIDWDQWDAFVAESNLMGPLS